MGERLSSGAQQCEAASNTDFRPMILDCAGETSIQGIRKVFCRCCPRHKRFECHSIWWKKTCSYKFNGKTISERHNGLTQRRSSEGTRLGQIWWRRRVRTSTWWRRQPFFTIEGDRIVWGRRKNSKKCLGPFLFLVWRWILTNFLDKNWLLWAYSFHFGAELTFRMSCRLRMD